MCDTLYITDLDGTLLDREDKVPGFTAQAISFLMERGLPFTCATARSWISAQKVTAGVKFSLPVIVYNGAFLVDPKTGKRLSEHAFPSEQRAFLQALFSSAEVSTVVYAFVEGEERVSWRTDRENEGVSYYLENRKGDRRLRPVLSDRELYRGEPFYFTCIGAKEELLPLWEQIREEKGWNSTFQQELYREEYWLEVMPGKATKAFAAKELKALLGYKRLVVFGDAVNDLPLFRIADESCAVMNAVPEVKAAASRVIPGNQENGVAKWLLEHGRLPGGKTGTGFFLRPYKSEDLEDLIHLFYETVHTVNRRDYSETEVNAWAPSPESVDRKAWDGSLKAHDTWVAQGADGSLLGFADLDGDYLDRLYVHKDFQGKGVAAALLDALEKSAWENHVRELKTHASITARPFFEKRGYRVEQEQQVVRRGVLLTNFVMKKAL